MERSRSFEITCVGVAPDAKIEALVSYERTSSTTAAWDPKADE
jgi:hypothetical protein